MIRPHRLLTVLGLSLLFFTAATPLPAATSGKPNILILYVDDMGYGTLSCYGSKVFHTPHIDALAAKGVRCTQGYVSAPLCSPSRCGVMSGHYQERFSHDDNSMVDAFPIKYPTLPERMAPLGYDTMMVGKWHCGSLAGQRPSERGFGEFYGTLENPGSYSIELFIDSRVSPNPVKLDTPNFYTTDAYTDRACRLITEHKGKPWFFYLAYNAVHAPYDTLPKYVDEVKNLPENLQRFGAVLAGLDDGIGRVMQTLHDTGQDQNTLIFYISDNGSPLRLGDTNAPLRGFKFEMWEGGIRIPYFVVWPGHLPAGSTYDKPVMNLDVMPTIVNAAGGSIDAAWGLDGVDIVPYLSGSNSGRPHDQMDWRMDGKWAARDIDLKLVHEVGKGNPPNNNPPQLFDLSADTPEKNDLAPSSPDKVQQLKSQWDTWNSQMGPAPEKKGKNGRNGRNGRKPLEQDGT